jgi:hypothetical protein
LLSRTIITDLTGPKGSNSALSRDSSTSYANRPTNSVKYASFVALGFE